MQDGEALEREVRVDGVDAVEIACPWGRRQTAGEDRLDVRRRDGRLIRQLTADPREEAADERLVAEHRARLHRADGVAADGPVRGTQLDPRQLGSPCRKGLES